VKAAIYARKSTSDERVEENKSIQRQIEHATKYAESLDYTIDKAHVFSDDGISGAEFLERPGLLSMLSKLKEFDALFMSEISRLGRDMTWNGVTIANITSNGVKIYYYLSKEEEKADTPEQKIMMYLKSYAAEVERAKAGERTRDALIRRFKKGYSAGGKVYGYDNIPIYGKNDLGENIRTHTEYQVNEEQAEVIKGIFQMYADGYGMKVIARALNLDKKYIKQNNKYFSGMLYKPPFNKSNGWAPSCIREMLYRKRYIGILEYGKTKRVLSGGSTKKKIKNLKPRTVEFENFRIIDDQLWVTVQKRLKEMSRLYMRNTSGLIQGKPETSRRSKYLLSGLGKCGCCGGNIVFVGGGARNYQYYGCSYRINRGSSICSNNHKVNMHELDRKILMAVQNQVLNPETIDYVVSKALSKIQQRIETPPEIKSKIEKNIKQVGSKLSNLITLAESGAEDSPSIIKSIREREVELSKLNKDLEEATAAMPAEIDIEKAKIALKRGMQDFQSLMMSNVPKARQALRKLLDGPIIFKPAMVDGVKTFDFEGHTKLGPLLEFNRLYNIGAEGETRYRSSLSN